MHILLVLMPACAGTGPPTTDGVRGADTAEDAPEPIDASTVDLAGTWQLDMQEAVRNDPLLDPEQRAHLESLGPDLVVVMNLHPDRSMDLTTRMGDQERTVSGTWSVAETRGPYVVLLLEEPEEGTQAIALRLLDENSARTELGEVIMTLHRRR
ncbi:MAG: hypothetical protein EA398_08660 [Deltaproteobacteria bacterium]|nr:MAG: hypothetical protein EA398_08660 [Deltaproteobacteria bacterium]